MTGITDLARQIMAKARSSLAQTERAGVCEQELRLIPGMPAAPEPCALAGGKWAPEKHFKHAIGQMKVNGLRCLYIDKMMLTRQAQPFNAALHCMPALFELEQRFGEPMVIDGEYFNSTFEKSMSDFKSGIGEGVFWVFDAVPYSEWRTNKFTQPLSTRLARISEVFDHEQPFVSLIDGWKMNADEAKHSALAVWRQGQEGLVIKDANSLYTRGRTKDWLKLKQTVIQTGPIVDAILDGKRCKTLLVKLDGGVVKVSAMSSDIRNEISRHKLYSQGREVMIGFSDRSERGKLQGARVLGWAK